MYIVTTALPELRLYRRGGSVTERCCRSLHRRLPSGTPCPRVHFAYSLRQPRVVHHLPTPSILTIDRATSCRLLKYIRSAATVLRLVTELSSNPFKSSRQPYIAINSTNLMLVYLAFACDTLLS